ncbi:hypothetical protein ACRAWD_12575 [Caulobacter segnis]
MLASVLLLAWASLGLVEDGRPVATAASTPAPAAAQDADTTQRGVIPYPPEFFAAAQPSTALDMIARLPGFTLDQGDSARGFAGTAGNAADQRRAPDHPRASPWRTCCGGSRPRPSSAST